jgi:NACHT domain-containing protein
VLLWVVGLLFLVWLWRTQGFDTVSGVVGVVGAVVALVPFLPPWLRFGPPAAGSDEAQVRGGALQFALAVRLQWEEEAKRRRMDDANEMPVRWQVRPGSNAEAARRLALGATGEIDELITAFVTDPQKLVVVGEPGAGKTGLLLRLALAFCERPGELPVPVLLPIADWDPADNVYRWLERRIADDYPFLTNEARYGGTLVRSLLEQDRVVLLLDGLDELPPSRQRESVERLRQDLRAPQAVVLTCRTAEFARITQAFHGLAVVELLPLPHAAAAGYLESAADGDLIEKWRPVTDRLRAEPDGPLAQALTTPLNLFLAGVAYDPDDRDPGELLTHTTQAQVEQHLLDAFVPTVFRERPAAGSSVDIPRPRVWRVHDVERWMRFLGEYLHRSGSREFAWWRLSDSVPRWFAVLYAVLIGTTGNALLGAALFGLYRRPLLGAGLGGLIGLLGGLVSPFAHVEEPRRMVPRTLTRHDLSMRQWTRDLVFTLVAITVGGVLVGILYGALYGVLVGAVFGVGAGLVRRLSGPTEPRAAVNPLDLLVGDRTALLLSALLGGWIGALMGAFLLGFVGPGQPDGPGPAIVTLGGPAADALLGAVVGFGTGAVGLGLLVLSTSAWGRLSMARTWFALTGRLPWRLMTFLEDAHDLGVLRHSGPYYQFRHSLLQDRIVATAAPRRTP